MPIEPLEAFIIKTTKELHLLNEREKAIVAKAETKAKATGKQDDFDYFVAKGFASNHLPDPAILTAQVIERDLDVSRRYDPLEFAAPSDPVINTFPEDEIPNTIKAVDIDFQVDNIVSGINGGGVIGKYNQKKYFFKQSYNRHTIMSSQSGFASYDRPITNPCQETVYVNLFRQSPVLRDSVPRSCVFVTPETVVLIDDVVKQDHLSRPQDPDTLKQINSDRTIMMMDALPVENSFTYLPIEQKIDLYISTIFEFHRFAAKQGISMRDDKADCYCLDAEKGKLMRYDFGGCVNYNHKLDQLPADLLQNVLKNIQLGLYDPYDKTTRLGKLEEFDFTKTGTAKLDKNPKGLLIYLYSKLLSHNNSSPEAILNTLTQLFESIKKAYSMTAEARQTSYQNFLYASVMDESQTLELITLLETEMDDAVLSEMVATHKDKVNLFLSEKIGSTDAPPITALSQKVVAEKVSNSSEVTLKIFDIEADLLVDMIKQFNKSEHGIDTNIERALRGIKLIQRWSGCKNLAEFILLTRDEIISRIPDYISFEDRFETSIILDRLQKFVQNKTISIE